MREPLPELQYNHGLEMLDACCKEVGLGRADMAKVLIKLPELKYFYNWNNAADFLGQFLYGPAEPVKPGPAERSTYPIPLGWSMVLEGSSQAGDKFWERDQWSTVSVSAGFPWNSYDGPLIRQFSNHDYFRELQAFPRSPRQG